jgi:uncharacterized protein (DUF362 family)
MGRVRVGCAVSETRRNTPPYKMYEDERNVAELVRSALLQAGLAKKDPDAPLRDIIQSGSTVLVKPNWVLDYRRNDPKKDCLVTHPTFVKSALAEVLKCGPARVILGDAPIQACRWDKTVPPAFREQLINMGRAHDVPVEFVDFRRTIAKSGEISEGVSTDVRDQDRFVLFDLGTDSLLEPISTWPSRFRVTMYDPGKLTEKHCPGRHQYLLCREAFETDVVLSLPKLKVHRKAGITGGLKNLVGLNGNKDYLPHHRFGGSDEGGDCYPGRSLTKRLAERLMDSANRRIGLASYRPWAFASAVVRKLSTRRGENLDGGWYGNDTSWRMVLDLNRILLYGRTDGSLADRPQRKLYSLTDAIVCGEGDGPLSPTPCTVGAVTFCDSAPAADVVHACLLHLNYRRIPLVREAFGRFRWPLTDDDSLPEIYLEDRQVTLDEIAREVGVSARCPSQWVGQVEWSQYRAHEDNQPPAPARVPQIDA